MALLIALSVFLVLFIGFVVLTLVEKKRGARVVSGARAALDETVANAVDTVRSTNLLGSLTHGALVIAGHIAHDFTAAMLRAVRILERALHSTHQKLRRERAVNGASGFAKLLPHFKRVTPAAPAIDPAEIVSASAVE